MPIDLDMDVLRTLLAAQQLGALNRAAEKIGRSQSAVTQQIRKLEDRIGQPLFRKQGRGLILTEAGEIILAYAQRIVDLNDEAVSVIGGIQVKGVVRFGFSGDFAQAWLPDALDHFKRAYPNTRVEATVDRNAHLIDRLEKGLFDLAVVLSANVPAEAEVLATLPMRWIGLYSAWHERDEPLQLALLEAPCSFRSAAINALDEAGIRWEIAFTTPNLSGLWAAVKAGLGITVRTGANLYDTGVAPNLETHLPALPHAHVFVNSAGRPLTPAAARLKDVLLKTMPDPFHTSRDDAHAKR